MTEPNVSRYSIDELGLLARASHEIRNPLNGVVGLVDLLLDTELSPDQRRSAQLIKRSIDSLLTLLNDMLDFSKLRAESVQLEDILFDLPALVDDTVRLLAARAFERKIDLSCDVHPDVPRMVRGDPSRLRQILVNLIGNAVKFTHEGGVTVGVSPDGEPETGRVGVRFDVRDTGIGIPKEKQDAIFREFTQADPSIARRYGGTGLGLPIAKRLADLMGGSLTVASAVGEGSTFTLRITLGQGTRQEHATGPAPSAGSARILILDDTASTRDHVRATLNAAGMTARAAETAGDAIGELQRAAAAAEPYHLVILDSWVGGEDGFDLARRIRSDTPAGAPRIMILAAAGRRGDGQRCRELGIDAYFVQPISEDDLVAAVSATLLDSSADGLVTRHWIEERRRRLRVLVADDNEVSRVVTGAILERRGHRVDAVDNGRAALERATAEPYDVLLMDVEMPDMDGVDAATALRAQPSTASLPIIAMTGHAGFGDSAGYRSARMSAFLAKPCKPQDLIRVVESLGAATPAARITDGLARSSRPLNLAEFRRAMREAGIEGTAAKILDVFREDAPEKLAALGAAIAARDGGEIRMAAHAFKSAAATVRAENLAALLSEIERSGKSGDVHHAEELIGQVRSEAESVLDFLGTIEAV